MKELDLSKFQNKEIRISKAIGRDIIFNCKAYQVYEAYNSGNKIHPIEVIGRFGLPIINFNEEECRQLLENGSVTVTRNTDRSYDYFVELCKGPQL